MKLLVDAFDQSQSDVKTVLTEEAGQKKYYIKGFFAQAEKKNRNGRNYPRSSMEKALEQYAPMISAKRALD